RRAETEWAATAQVGTRAEQAAALARAAAQAAAGLEQARRRVAELKEQETHGRAARRQAEEALAQVTARHDALAELERERVGLAPAAQALLKAREQFGDAVIGPLSDFVRTTRRDAVLAEQLLGEWLHAVLVRDAAAVDTIRRWHEQAQPGPLVLLPSVPGPRLAADGHPLKDDLRVDGPAAAWVRALLAGHEVLEGGEKGGRALRRANGAVFLAGPTAAGGGPLERRAEREALAQEVREAEARRGGAATTLERTLAELAAAEAAFAAAGAAAERARQQELEAGALKDDAARAAAHAQREAGDATAQVERLQARLGEVGARLDALHADLEGHEVERVRLDERLGRGPGRGGGRARRPDGSGARGHAQGAGRPWRGGAQTRARAHRGPGPPARARRAGRGRMAEALRSAARRRARGRGRSRVAAPGGRAVARGDRRGRTRQRPRGGRARRGGQTFGVPDDAAGRPGGRASV